MWRPPDEDRVLLMAGMSTDYAVDPRAEYVFGVVSGQPMQSRRGAERRLVEPGRLVAWDPSNTHAGTATDARPWTSRVMVIDAFDLAALASDDETGPLANVVFPEPVVSDPQVVDEFLAAPRRIRHADHPAGTRRAARGMAPHNGHPLFDPPPVACRAQRTR